MKKKKKKENGKGKEKKKESEVFQDHDSQYGWLVVGGFH